MSTFIWGFIVGAFVGALSAFLIMGTLYASKHAAKEENQVKK